MSTTTSPTGRSRLLRVAATAVSAVLVTSVPLGGSAAAHEPLPSTQVAETAPYSTPLDALGGLTLAQYLALHQARVLGPSPV